MDLSQLKTNRTMQGIVALFSAVVIMLVGIVLLLQTLSPLKSQQSELELALEGNIQRLNRILVMAQNEEQTRATYEALLAALPASVNQNDVFDSIQTLSQKYRLKGVEAISFGKEQPAGDVIGIPVALTCTGDYGRVMSLVEEYTTGGRLTQLSKLTLHSEGKSAGSVRAEVEFMVYYSPV